MKLIIICWYSVYVHITFFVLKIFDKDSRQAEKQYALKLKKEWQKMSGNIGFDKVFFLHPLWHGTFNMLMDTINIIINITFLYP